MYAPLFLTSIPELIVTSVSSCNTDIYWTTDETLKRAIIVVWKCIGNDPSDNLLAVIQYMVAGFPENENKSDGANSIGSQ